jgi:hypothetical protein
MNQNFGAELDSSMMLDSNMLLDSYMILDSSMIVETDSNMILDSSMMVETDSLNDEWEESDGESLANEMKVINRPLSKQFRNSKYNKKTYPSGFKVNVSRHEQFLHSAQNANGKNRSDGDEGQETHRTNFSQLSNEKIAECSKPKTSFMFWAQGNPHRTDVDHHKMPISDATTAPPYSAGYRMLCRKLRYEVIECYAGNFLNCLYVILYMCASCFMTRNYSSLRYHKSYQ